MEVIFKNLSLTVEDMAPVKKLNLTIPHGQLVSLFGPDEGGKSITLLMLAGVYKPTEGSIFIGENDVTDWAIEHREVEVVFKRPILFPRKSVLKNISNPLLMKKVPKREAINLAKEMAELFHIEHLVNLKPHQLTEGQKRRVGLARAMVTCPKVLILDDPLVSLDVDTGISLLRDIRRIQQQVRMTTLLVTNQQEEALSVSDKVLLMKDGIPLHYSSPDQLTHHSNQTSDIIPSLIN